MQIFLYNIKGHCHQGLVSRGQKLVTVVKERPLTLLHYLLLYTTSSLQRSIFQGECLLQIVPRKMALVHQSKCKLNFLSSSGLPAPTYILPSSLKVNQFRKGFLVFSILPKNEQKISAPAGQGKNLSFQVCFLGELETPKIYFEIN